MGRIGRKCRIDFEIGELLNNAMFSERCINILNKLLLRPKKALSLYEKPARNRVDN